MLATKLHIPELNGKSVSDTVKEHLRTSMKRLQTDHIDLYYWHRVNPAVSLEEVAAAMGELIKDGDIGGWGLSQITEEQLRLVMRLKELGVTEEMINGIAENSLIMDSGYKALNKEEIVDILKKVCDFTIGN